MEGTVCSSLLTNTAVWPRPELCGYPFHLGTILWIKNFGVKNVWGAQNWITWVSNPFTNSIFQRNGKANGTYSGSPLLLLIFQLSKQPRMLWTGAYWLLPRLRAGRTQSDCEVVFRRRLNCGVFAGSLNMFLHGGKGKITLSTSFISRNCKHQTKHFESILNALQNKCSFNLNRWGLCHPPLNQGVPSKSDLTTSISCCLPQRPETQAGFILHTATKEREWS